MEEQAEARPDRAAFEGPLPMVDTPHDPDYNEPEDIAERSSGLKALQALVKKVPKSGKPKGKATANPVVAFGLREQDVVKVVKERIFSMAIHPSTEPTVFAGVRFHPFQAWCRDVRPGVLSRRPVADSKTHLKPC